MQVVKPVLPVLAIFLYYTCTCTCSYVHALLWRITIHPCIQTFRQGTSLEWFGWMELCGKALAGPGLTVACVLVVVETLYTKWLCWHCEWRAVHVLVAVYFKLQDAVSVWACIKNFGLNVGQYSPDWLQCPWYTFLNTRTAKSVIWHFSCTIYFISCLFYQL